MEDEIDVWLFILSLSPGGAERHLVNLANYLHEKEVNVSVYTVFRENPLRDDLNDDLEFHSLGIPAKMGGVDNTQIKSAKRLYHYPIAVLWFLWQVRRHRPDVIQSYLFYDNVIARLSKTVRPGITVISGVRAVPTDRSIFKNVIDRLTIPLSDHIVSNSEAGKSMAIDLGASPSDVSVIYNAKDISKFRKSQESNIRDELGIHTGDALFGNVARLIERKGQYELLEAWSSAGLDRTKSHLIIVGDGPEYEALQKRIKELGIGDSVYLVGYREDVPALLQSFDYFVFPSHFEGLPGALIEAMAAGLPIVATDIPGNRELISDMETGILTEPGGVGDLKVKMELLVKDKKLSNLLSENARTFIEDNISIEGPSKEHVELYNVLLIDD